MKPIIYEVNLNVDANIADAFEPWLREHVADMLVLPGFIGAQVFRVDPEGLDQVAWSVHYRLRSRTALDDYLNHHAARMRKLGQERFPDQFSASRRVLEPQEDY